MSERASEFASGGEVTFREASAEKRVQSLPFAHLSIELGHLYFEDFASGADGLRRHFEQVGPWVEALRSICARSMPGRTPRISTCFLIDDYFGPTSSPAKILPDLLEVAAESGFPIDYLARESACAEADGVPLARLVEERIVADPPPDTTGTRPPVTEVGWLCNGQRSPSMATAQAMDTALGWAPPTQNAANRHSIFVDVELWDERSRGRTWSCAFLASVWQLIRLGVLRWHGGPVVVPRAWDEEFPDDWNRLPAVIAVNPAAVPFTAYRVASVLAGRFLATEQAVRTILSQVAVDDEAAAQVLERGRGEKLALPPELVDRIDYVFLGPR